MHNYFCRGLLTLLCLCVGISCPAQRILKPITQITLKETGFPITPYPFRYIFPPVTFHLPYILTTPLEFPEMIIEKPSVGAIMAGNFVPHSKSKAFAGPKDLALLTKRQTDGIIFDLDGTLLDSLGAWEHSGSNYVRSLGIEPMEELDKILETMSLLDGANFIKETYQLVEEPEEILAATLAPIKAHYYTDIQAKPQVPLLLAFLHAQGIKMAVATASDADLAKAALERLGLLHYFEFVITCDEVGIGKTDPRVYEQARRRLGTSKNRTVVVEDAPYALKTAHQAGFRTIGVAERKSAKQEPLMRQIADIFLSFY